MNEMGYEFSVLTISFVVIDTKKDAKVT